MTSYDLTTGNTLQKALQELEMKQVLQNINNSPISLSRSVLYVSAVAYAFITLISVTADILTPMIPPTIIGVFVFKKLQLIIERRESTPEKINQAIQEFKSEFKKQIQEKFSQDNHSEQILKSLKDIINKTVEERIETYRVILAATQ